jgi:hypothetical protein
LRPGTVEGLQEVSFGSGSGVGRILQCREFAFDAQQLGHVPAFVAGFTAGERLLDGCQPSHDLTGLAETHRQLPKQQQEARQEPRIAGLFEPAAQSLQPTGKITAAYDWKTARPMSAPCKMRRLEVLRRPSSACSTGACTQRITRSNHNPLDLVESSSVADYRGAP